MLPGPLVLGGWRRRPSPSSLTGSHMSFSSPLQALPFSHLILATGSMGPFPGKFNEVSCQQAAIQAYEDMVKQVGHTDGCGTGWAGQSAVGGPERGGLHPRAGAGRLWDDLTAV